MVMTPTYVTGAPGDKPAGPTGERRERVRTTPAADTLGLHGPRRLPALRTRRRARAARPVAPGRGGRRTEHVLPHPRPARAPPVVRRPAHLRRRRGPGGRLRPSRRRAAHPPPRR